MAFNKEAILYWIELITKKNRSIQDLVNRRKGFPMLRRIYAKTSLENQLPEEFW